MFSSPRVLDALRTTLMYSVVGTVSSIGIGLAATLALRGPFRGRTFVRASMLLPYVAPVVAVTFVWQTMLSPQFGIVNAIGTDGLRLGRPDRVPVAALGGRHRARDRVHGAVALLTVMVFEAWRYFPFAFLFLTARIQAVPRDLEEAAQVDGATPTQRFRYIVLPQLLPTIALLAVLRFIFTFNKFDDIYLLTGGGAGTQVVSVRVYDFLTSRGDIGAASAQALVLALILVVLVAMYFRFVGRSTGDQRDAHRARERRLRPVGGTGSTSLEPRPRGDPGVRGAAPGRHRRAPGGHAVPVLLHGGAVVPRRSRRCCRPALLSARRDRLEHLRDVLAPSEDGGQGFLTFMRNSAFVAVRHRGAHPAGRDPRRVRGEPAGVLRPPPGRARCSSRSTSSRRSCWRSRCSCSSPGSGSAARCSDW